MTHASCDDLPAAANLQAFDECDGLKVEVNFSEEIIDEDDCASTYIIERTWTATDCAGNTTTHTQMVEVSDTVPPVFDGPLPIDENVVCAEVGEAPVLTASDNCDELVAVMLTETITGVDDDTPLTYILTRTWMASDCSGNSVQHTQVLTIEEAIAPIFVEDLPEDLLGENAVECSDLDTPAVLTAIDGCTGEPVEVVYSEEDTKLEEGCASYVLRRRWVARNENGRTVHVQRIRVRDRTAPVFDLPLPENLVEENAVTIDNIPEAPMRESLLPLTNATKMWW